ncbi:MAG: hypothetical protein WCJ75_09670 [Desulfomonile sp.]
MHSVMYKSALLAILLFAVNDLSSAWAADHNYRFFRNYPPGYYGMYYYSQRFFEKAPVDKKTGDSYRWDKFMSRVTEIEFPFFPIPYEWNYGTDRTFNLPDYNRNDWP